MFTMCSSHHQLQWFENNNRFDEIKKNLLQKKFAFSKRWDRLPSAELAVEFLCSKIKRDSCCYCVCFTFSWFNLFFLLFDNNSSKTTEWNSEYVHCCANRMMHQDYFIGAPMKASTTSNRLSNCAGVRDAINYESAHHFRIAWLSLARLQFIENFCWCQLQNGKKKIQEDAFRVLKRYEIKLNTCVIGEQLKNK